MNSVKRAKLWRGEIIEGSVEIEEALLCFLVEKYYCFRFGEEIILNLFRDRLLLLGRLIKILKKVKKKTPKIKKDLEWLHDLRNKAAHWSTIIKEKKIYLRCPKTDEIFGLNEKVMNLFREKRYRIVKELCEN